MISANSDEEAGRETLDENSPVFRDYREAVEDISSRFERKAGTDGAVDVSVRSDDIRLKEHMEHEAGQAAERAHDNARPSDNDESGENLPAPEDATSLGAPPIANPTDSPNQPDLMSNPNAEGAQPADGATAPSSGQPETLDRNSEQVDAHQGFSPFPKDAAEPEGLQEDPMRDRTLDGAALPVVA